MASFKIGINMAGAISAGAYTAGVLDFLTEALDAWYAAKAAGEIVPAHDVSIEVFTGASAGGMCAAISAIMLQQDFEHIDDTSRTGTDNRFYESWVNRIDIRALLQTDDLKQGTPVVSLLDSTIIDQIAEYALAPGTPIRIPRPYVSPDLNLVLSLTNLRGVPYSLNGAAPGSIEETTFFYGDRIRFQTVRADSTASLPGAVHAIDLTAPSTAASFLLLQTAAKATGAFPLFLAPRVIVRGFGEYTPPLWESCGSAAVGAPPPISPDFPARLRDPFPTLNVDGGVTNNDPFNYAHDYLSALEPPASPDSSDPRAADRAVISIAPFPTTEAFQLDYDARKNSSIFRVLPHLFAALVSQSRFFGESLDGIMQGTTFNRFVIAPSDDALAKNQAVSGRTEQAPALQCAALGAFGGFFERGFRAHDYALGRRNCQKFLLDSFVLPADNVVIATGLQTGQAHERLIRDFARPAPLNYAGQSDGAVLQNEPGQAKAWIPVIPLCGPRLTTPLPPVPRAQMTRTSLHLIVKLITRRLRSVGLQCLGLVPALKLRAFLWPGLWIIPWLARRPLTATLKKQLGDSYKP